MSKEFSNESKRSKSKKPVVTILYVLLLLALAGFGGYYFLEYRDTVKKYNDVSKQYNDLIADPRISQLADSSRYISEVSKLYQLPTNEEPSIATVKDKEKLKDQAFFAKAENGDVTLIYSNAKLAILYRPSTKQLVNVSSVTIQDQQQGTETQPAPQQ